MPKMILVYGFEYEWKIFFKGNAILCKSFKTDHIIYACPFIIEVTNINNIIEQIKYFEINHKDLVNDINKLAKSRYAKCYWQLAFYSEDQKFYGISYESEGDENGNGR
jgi:hypothetical protein